MIFLLRLVPGLHLDLRDRQALGPREDARILVPNKIDEDHGPAGVGRDGVVKLGRELPERRQPRPGHRGEIVVLVVVADVVGEDVERAIVRVRLLVEAVPEVVLGDEVAGERVERAGEEGGEEEVEEGGPAPGADDERVEGELREQVGGVPPCRGLCADEAGPEGVEEDLEGGEEELAEDVVEQEELEPGRQVGVDAVFAEVFVVLDVVPLCKDVRPCGLKN
jgi:hypothetical protein